MGARAGGFHPSLGPLSLRPHAKTRAQLESITECASPHAAITTAIPTSEVTALGEGSSASNPVPSWPLSPAPLAYTQPERSMSRLCCPPAAIALTKPPASPPEGAPPRQPTLTDALVGALVGSLDG